MKPSEQIHFRILRAIESQPDITQRELAQQLGVSKGKTNYLIAALIEKGLIKIGNFQRGEDKLGKIAYLLTAAGIKNRAALTRAYLARKEAEYKALKAEIQALRKMEDTLPEDIASAGSERI
ncbi:MAG: MarR family EPS-associated transcriptional regulator [Sideroxydans sp.]|jgi:EPS-associated MarR family transcriptional regulator